MQIQTGLINYAHQNYFTVSSTNTGNKEFNNEALAFTEDAVTKLLIKNMISIRCKMFVKAQLNKLGLHYTSIELGEVVLPESLSAEQRDQLKSALVEGGLELMDDKKTILVEKIKNSIDEMLHYAVLLPKTNYSDYISRKLNLDYIHLSKMFSSLMGISLKQFIINYKIEKVKELLCYSELTLSEISYELNYSSVAHLSNQFKKATGLSPAFFKSTSQGEKVLSNTLA